jgi:hypothetical protein
MSKNAREIESKLIVESTSLKQIADILETAFEQDTKKSLYGSSLDHYFLVPDRRARADFFRVRERDGIRQITVKGEDKGNVLDRMEIDIDSTSPIEDILKMAQAMFGPALGRISKTYHVYFINKWDTVCCYKVTEPNYDKVIVEVEASTMEKMLDLERRAVEGLASKGIEVYRAPGSLYNMFIK